MINCIKCNTEYIPIYELEAAGSNKFVCKSCALHITRNMEVKNDKRITKN